MTFYETVKFDTWYFTESRIRQRVKRNFSRKNRWLMLWQRHQPWN